MNTTGRTIQDHPTNAADLDYFAGLTAQTQDALWDQADNNLGAARITVAAAWKSAIQGHKATLRSRYTR